MRKVNHKITKGKIGWWLLIGLLFGLVFWQVGSLFFWVFTGFSSLIVFWRYRFKGLILVLIIFVTGGAGYLRTISQIPQYNLEHIAHQIGRGENLYDIEVSGVVQVSTSNLVSFPGRVTQNGREYFGEIWVTGRFPSELLHGDIVSVTGTIERSLYYKNYPAAISFPEFIEVREGKWSFARVLLGYRQKFIERINARIVEPYASLVSGILVGNKSGLTKEIKQSLSQVGLAHIVVVSGMHLLIVMAALQKSLSKLFTRKKTAIILLASILLFVIFTGAAPSTIRAGFMATLVILLPLFARGRSPARVLLVTAVIAFLWDPTLQTNLGFQLSFAATAGILFTRHYWESLLDFLPNFGQIRTIAALTCAAQMAVAPLLLVYFENLAWIAPLINVLVAPLLPYIMLSGLILVVVPGFMASIIQLATLFFSWPVIKIADFSNTIPGWSFTLKISTAIGLYVAMIIVFYFLMKIPIWRWLSERNNRNKRLIKNNQCLVL